MSLRLGLALVLLATPAVVLAQLGSAPPPPGSGDPVILREIGFDQKLGGAIPLGAVFRDESGREVRLGAYFGDRPVVLSLVYYDCPMLCTLSLNGLARALKVLSFVPGQEFEVLTVSFDPSETPALAAAKKKAYMAQYDRKEGAQGWHFLTGDTAAVESLTQAVGFRYVWDDDTQQFAHPAGIVILTPEGAISHYLFGVEYSPERHASRPRRFRRRPDREPHRPGAPLLLPVRPLEGPLQRFDPQRRARRRAPDRRPSWSPSFSR